MKPLGEKDVFIVNMKIIEINVLNVEVIIYL